MHLPDSEREIIDPAQAEHDAVITAFVEQNPTDLQRRRDDLAAIQQSHRWLMFTTRLVTRSEVAQRSMTIRGWCLIDNGG
ncbi:MULTISPECIES: hypothetical protein [unclassified Ruegeria]|uniref:hypothetical protein n=1 Tax=unclassified Ruegeria TaxID=2625375 RepID=UPI001487B67A|nr:MULTISPECIES: hypothetical protein [unclassified Ruegeria]NOD76741.1 hypothetical protein [Ruegeria sp. HKCCD4332]NOD88251.1 hypothetical protein [Ruegeria sp. HKCCD4318]NOE13160.1 hypothetical protein [Ruegeria sp. HKCCD4318-2]NOG11298.1 hypothetical protein [Ruegeria sp. HKCCD4315]